MTIINININIEINVIKEDKMPRNMSFALTIKQFKAKTKTVTRRFGWWFLEPGDILMGCKKCMGFKKGEKIERLGLIRVVLIRKEPLYEITKEDCIKEGFPEMNSNDFIKMICDYSKCYPTDSVNRIEFEYIN